MEKEKKEILQSALLPFVFTFIMWGVKLVEFINEVSFYRQGIYPRAVGSLTGIFTAPFIHGDFSHLINNSIPLLILGTSLFYFYKEIAIKVFVLLFLTSGFWLWFMGRPSYHIGASAFIYGLFSFLLVSGMLRRHKSLMVISLLVVFLYGSLVWGIFPIKYEVSFEGHFVGFLSGLVFSIYYRKRGLQQEVHVWEDEEEELDEKLGDGENTEAKNVENNPPYTIKYHYKKGE